MPRQPRFLPTGNERARRLKDTTKHRRDAEATDALPGTPDKFAELQRRAAAGVSLFAEGDCVEDDSRATMVALAEGNFWAKVVGEVRERILPDGTPASIGGRVKHFRLRMGLSIKQLAFRAGICHSQVTRLERSLRRSPSLSVLLALAGVLTGGSLDALVGQERRRA